MAKVRKAKYLYQDGVYYEIGGNDSDAVDQVARDAAAAAQESANNAQTDAQAAQATADSVDNSLKTYVRPNLLDNWYFVGGGSQQGYGYFPLNSNGQTIYTGTGTTIDIWEGGNSHSVLTLYSDGMAVTSNSSGSDGYINQFFANQSLLLGKTVTLSVLGSNGELQSQTATLPSTFPASTSFIEFSLTNGPTVYLRVNGSGQLSVRFQTRAQSLSTKIIAVKLELGSTQTLAHQENGVWVLNEVPKYRLEAVRPWKLVWENASPSSAFAAQTVALDLSGFDEFACDYTTDVSGGTPVKRAFARMNERFVMQYFTTDSSKIYPKIRTGEISSTGVAFSDNRQYNATSNTYNKPYRIYAR